ncbi:MAG: hypothetical protein QM658_16605 [Gordonia sp. (in: high G+C Gram-positive bacteria)]
MNDWGVFAGLGLIAATIAAVAYVRYRQHESSTLRHDAELATSLRELADGDAVRLAAVAEFETVVYQRLFYSSVVGPRMRSAVWALLGAVLSVSAALVLDSFDNSVSVIAWGSALVVAGLFTVAAVVFIAMAALSAATTPRVSFADSYAAAGEDDEATAQTDDEAPLETPADKVTADEATTQTDDEDVADHTAQEAVR